MLFTDTESARLKAIIEDTARQWSAKELEQIKKRSEDVKPPAYDEVSRRVAEQYEGNQGPQLDAALQKRFRNGHSSMAGVRLNRMAHVARADSGVYRLPAVRTLVDATGQQVPATDPRAALFAKLVESSEINALAPEIERRSIVAKTLFVRSTWQAGLGGKEGKVSFEVFWPHDVSVICHESGPTNFDRAYIVLVKTSSTPEETWYSLWCRTPIEDEAGNLVEFTPWRVHVVSSRGTYQMPPDDPRTLYVDNMGNPLPLPFSLIHLGIPAGSVYVPPDRDLPDFLINLNVDATAERFKHDLQSHTPVVFRGSSKQASEIAWGAGELIHLPDNQDNLETLTLDGHLQESRDMRGQFEGDLAKVRGQNPNQYLTKPSAPESGVARLISQQSHEAVLDENELRFASWEKTQLWPITLSVYDAFSGNPVRFGDVTVDVKMRRQAIIEEPETKQRRLQADVDAGVISQARYAVEMGYYPDISAAVADGLSDEKGAKKPAAPSFNWNNGG